MLVSIVMFALTLRVAQSFAPREWKPCKRFSCSLNRKILCKLQYSTPWGDEVPSDEVGEGDDDPFGLFNGGDDDILPDAMLEKLGSGSDRNSEDSRGAVQKVFAPLADIDLDSLDGQLLLAMAAKSTELFDAAKQEVLTREAVLRWDRMLDQLLSEIQRISSKDIILKLYGTVLSKAALMTLDPLQMTTFQLTASALADRLMEIFPKSTPVTELIDEITDMHLEMAESLSMSMNEGSSSMDDGFTMSDEQEFLCYQYAGLVRYIYKSISTGLGADFEQDDVVGQMRLQSWVDPVYARMQRRFVRFIADNVDDRLDEEYANAFTSLLNRLQLELSPRYMLSGPLNSGTVQLDGSVTPDNSDGIQYPPWELADFVTRVIRNAVVSAQMVGIEPRVNYMFRSSISRRMQALNGPMLKLYRKPPTFLSREQYQDVEDMLNIGHECVAAVFTMWQVRHNIVGVPIDEEGKMVQKDYLRLVTLTQGIQSVLESIPISRRKWAQNEIREDIPRLEPDELLHSHALLSASVRKACEETFVGLSSFNLDSSEFPPDRDGIYMGVLTAFLTETLVAPVFAKKWMYENLIAFAALEETIAVRSPRASCQESYEEALVISIMRLLANKTASPMDLKERILEMERALGMILRMEEGDGNSSRIRAFKSCINRIISESDNRGDNGVRTVQQEYEWIASALQIDAEKAKRYVEPLGFERFDQTVMKLFLNADVAASMPDMGSMFVQRIADMAEAVMISEDDARDRAIYVAGLIFIQYMELAMGQHRKQRVAEVDNALQRAFIMFKHPLLVKITEFKSVAGDDIPKDVALQMVCMDRNSNAMMDFVRMIDGAKKRAVAAGSRGGSSVSSSSAFPEDLGSWGGVKAPTAIAGLDDVASMEEYKDFLTWMQTYLMTQFTEASMKGSS